MAFIRCSMGGGSGNIEIPPYYQHYYFSKTVPSSTKITCTDQDGNTFRPRVIVCTLGLISGSGMFSFVYDGISGASTFFQTPDNYLYTMPSTIQSIDDDGFTINSASLAYATDGLFSVMAFA